MKVLQKRFTKATGFTQEGIATLTDPSKAQLVLAFGDRHLVSDETLVEAIKKEFPKAAIVVGSSAGEILGTRVTDDTVVVTGISFENTPFQIVTTTIADSEESFDAGKRIATSLPHADLVHVLLFSEGLHVNGTPLVHGLSENLPDTVSVTGGLVGDGARFEKTLLGYNSVGRENQIIAIGLYGTHIKIGYGSLGGWDPFGIERTITKSKNNVLYELDNKPALSLYKDYLGEKAAELPGSGLLFPLSLKLKNGKGGDIEVVRTLLAVDEKDQSMTFAGDMPEGTRAKLMKANFDRLIDGAASAATMSGQRIEKGTAQLAILVSCIGRKLVLKERVEEEVEAVQEKIGTQAAITGFYSYGELCPTAPTENQCQLHNQTMTITTLREV